MAKNPPIKRTTKRIVMKLKYFSRKVLIGAPNLKRRYDTKINLPPLPQIDAKTNFVKSIEATPAAIVKILYGIGVNPAAKTIQKSYST